MISVKRARLFTQSAFFILFVLAPPLDIFRYDLNDGHFILLGQIWTLHIDASPQQQAINVVLYGLLPAMAFIISFLFIAWRWGRLYCGWLCPHFSVVETINRLMQRACGKPSLWEPKTLPLPQTDGHFETPNPLYWIPTILLTFSFALLWSVVLLTYLVPPQQIYGDLVTLSLTYNQVLFIGIGTLLFSADFLLARHLFCRYGCAVGLFQSLAWMSNRRAMVVSFNKSLSTACKSCYNACDNACPMRLQPRLPKRRMFTCTECGECITACTQVQGGDPAKSLLQWQSGDFAVQQSEPPMNIHRETH